MWAAPPLLALDRETLMLAALAALVVAGVVVSAGAWVLLWRGRTGRSHRDDIVDRGPR
ncbi:MAG: hypothetical protein ACRDGU_04580 [Actinomycetota bacterium]